MLCLIGIAYMIFFTSYAFLELHTFIPTILGFYLKRLKEQCFKWFLGFAYIYYVRCATGMQLTLDLEETRRKEIRKDGKL